LELSKLRLGKCPQGIHQEHLPGHRRASNEPLAGCGQFQLTPAPIVHCRPPHDQALFD
jgi:hypothetical protein